MHVQQATYANELHVNVQHLSFHKKRKTLTKNNKITKNTILCNSLCYGVIHEISQSTSCLYVSYANAQLMSIT